MTNTPDFKPRRRCWLQFSLRTFLIVSTLSAVGIWWGVSWYRGQKPQVTELPGGLLLWEEGRIEFKSAYGQPMLDSHGRFVVSDNDGHVWCRGRFDKGQVTGRWTWFHANGRTALSGDCARNFRAGVWTAQNEGGGKTLEMPHGSPQVVMARTRHSKSYAIDASNRQGEATEFHANGKPAMQGSFANDCREGLWVFWNEQGEITAEGEFRAGWRHGKWTIFDAPGGTPRSTWFISDLEVPDLSQRTAELGRLLDSDNWQTRVDAVDALGKLGALATPELRKALGNNDAVVVERVLEVLTSFGTEARDAVPDIRRLAENAAEGPVKTKTLLALLALDEPARDETLLTLLTHTDLEDDAACRELHMRMAQIGAPLLTHLAKALDSRDQQVRLAALDVLAVMVWPSEEDAWPFPHSEDYRPKLQQILERAQHHADPAIAKGAKEILRFLTDSMLSIPWRKYSPSPYGGSIIPVVG